MSSYPLWPHSLLRMRRRYRLSGPPQRQQRLRGPHLSSKVRYRTADSDVSAKWLNFPGLVLGCMDSYDSERRFIFQHSSITKKKKDCLTFYPLRNSKFQQLFVNFISNLLIILRFSGKNNWKSPYFKHFHRFLHVRSFWRKFIWILPNMPCS